MFRLNKFAFLFAVCAGFSVAAVNYPYPQQKPYGNGTINTTAANASTNLKSKFTSFLSSHYEEQTVNGKQLARIKFDSETQTVSEGIGYGMIMMVYFSDNATSYQNHFDKLWAYYNNFLNTNSLMHWKINGFSNVAEQNAATDAEFDVALALAMAHYQFGDQKYLNDAKSLIAKIRQHEISTNNLHKPGDVWDLKRNPSYVSPAAFEIFREIETDYATKWEQVISANYTLLKNNQGKSSVGLPSDWCNDDGSVNGANEFGYDASRAPWRWAWANAWYGHADAKTLLGNLVSWVNNQTPANVRGPIQLNGTFSGYNNSTFVGPLTNVLSYGSTYQSKMNDYWNALISINDNAYFSKAMQIITGLLATGNMPNLKALAAGGSPNSSSSSLRSSSSGAGVSTLIADFEGWGTDPEEPRYNYSRLGTPFYVYKVDNATIANPFQSGSTTDYEAVTQSGDTHGRVAWLKEGFNIGTKASDGNTNGAVVIGLNVNMGSLTGCTAFEYDYKGPAHLFFPNQRTHDGDSTTGGTKGDWNQPHGDDYLTNASSSWKTVRISVPGDLVASWGTTSTWVGANDIHKLTWEIKATSASSTANSTQSLMIDNIKCIGTNLSLPTPPSAGSRSSSSSSSSIRSSSSNRSSSSSVARSSSSSYRSSSGTASIALKIPAANEMLLVKNGVSLQVTINATLEVFGLNGNSVRKLDFASGTWSVQLSDLPKGLYIVKVSFGSEKKILRVPVN